MTRFFRPSAQARKSQLVAARFKRQCWQKAALKLHAPKGLG
jgi:hypothetical protein